MSVVFLQEIYKKDRYFSDESELNFVQDNRSVSRLPGTLRGLHFQAPPFAQGKLVSCNRGAIFDVVVDIRVGSPTYGHWQGFELSASNRMQIYVPVGFAHGFLTLEPDTDVAYKCTNYYEAKSEGSLHWASCGICWPINVDPVISEKDASAPKFSELDSPFLFGENS